MIKHELCLQTDKKEVMKHDKEYLIEEQHQWGVYVYNIKVITVILISDEQQHVGQNSKSFIYTEQRQESVWSKYTVADSKVTDTEKNIRLKDKKLYSIC